jgi:hypothetical protein
VITFGHRETDNSSRMITINGYFYLVNYCYVLQMGPMLSDHNKRLITSTVITLKIFHCINMKYNGRHFMWSWILIDQALNNFYFSIKSLTVNIRFMLSLYLSPKVITLSGFHCSKCFIFLLKKNSVLSRVKVLTWNMTTKKITNAKNVQLSGIKNVKSSSSEIGQ